MLEKVKVGAAMVKTTSTWIQCQGQPRQDMGNLTAVCYQKNVKCALC